MAAQLLRKIDSMRDANKDSPKIYHNMKSSMKKESSFDNMHKLENYRQNNESPSPNSVSDDSLFDELQKSSTKRVTFNDTVTYIKKCSTGDEPLRDNNENLKKKKLFLKKLKLDQDNKDMNSQQDCSVKSCSADMNDYMCTIQ